MITVTIAVVGFIAGAVASAIALVRAGIAREESENSLRDKPPTRTSAAARRMVGLYVLMPNSDSADDVTEMATIRPLPVGPGR